MCGRPDSMRMLGRTIWFAMVVVGFAASAGAATVIDFSTGAGGTGGTVTIGSNITGTNIFVDTVTISGADVNNGVFDVDGAGTCADILGGCGLLSFDENLN